MVHIILPFNVQFHMLSDEAYANVLRRTYSYFCSHTVITVFQIIEIELYSVIISRSNESIQLRINYDSLETSNLSFHLMHTTAPIS